MSIHYLDNKYTKWYYNIITKAQNRVTEEYTEEHHIIPKKIGGSNKKENMVRLTVREHYIVHHLLIKMLKGVPKKKMVHAFWCMSHTREEIKLNNRQYEYLKKIYAEMQSELSREIWNRPGHKEKMRLIQNDPEYIKNQSEKKKERWKDEEYRIKQESIRTSEEFRTKLSAIRKENCATQEFSDWARNLHVEKWYVCHPVHTGGKEILIEHLTNFCKQNGLSQGNMGAIARGTGGRKQHKGWTCRKFNS